MIVTIVYFVSILVRGLGEYTKSKKNIWETSYGDMLLDAAGGTLLLGQTKYAGPAWSL